jgi:Protein of unknown function (DUF1573)
MSRYRISATLAFLAAATIGIATAQTTAPAPKVVVAAPVFDFGRAKTGDQLSHSFSLKNEGTAPLLLREVRSDCACAATSFDETILPGATGAVRVVLDTTNMEGPLARTITVLTNDAATPSLALTVKAEALPILLMRPGYARYLYVQKEVPGRIVQSLWAGDNQDFNVLSVKSPYPHLVASFREATVEERRAEVKGKQWQVETVLSPDAPVGPLADWVEITTDHPKQKIAKFAVSGFVRPVIAVTPPTADLGPRTLENPSVGSLKVHAFSTGGIPVTSVDTDIKGLELKLETVEAGRIYKVVLTLTKAMPKGDFRGTVRIHTDSPKAPLLEVPVQGKLE